MPRHSGTPWKTHLKQYFTHITHITHRFDVFSQKNTTFATWAKSGTEMCTNTALQQCTSSSRKFPSNLHLNWNVQCSFPKYSNARRNDCDSLYLDVNCVECLVSKAFKSKTFPEAAVKTGAPYPFFPIAGSSLSICEQTADFHWIAAVRLPKVPNVLSIVAVGLPKPNQPTTLIHLCILLISSYLHHASRMMTYYHHALRCNQYAKKRCENSNKKSQSWAFLEKAIPQAFCSIGSISGLQDACHAQRWEELLLLRCTQRCRHEQPKAWRKSPGTPRRPVQKLRRNDIDV